MAQSCDNVTSMDVANYRIKLTMGWVGSFQIVIWLPWTQCLMAHSISFMFSFNQTCQCNSPKLISIKWTCLLNIYSMFDSLMNRKHTLFVLYLHITSIVLCNFLIKRAQGIIYWRKERDTKKKKYNKHPQTQQYKLEKKQTLNNNYNRQ